MRYLKRWQLAIVCLIALILAPVFSVRRSQTQAVNYTVTDLGTLGGAQSKAYGIDNCGRVVGESNLAGAPGANLHPFFWSEGQMTDMGTLNGSTGIASAINASGVAAGSSSRAFIWTAATGKTDIGTLGGAFSGANDINETNQVVGVSELNQFTDLGFIWQQSTGMQAVPTLGGPTSTAYGINNAGQVVGTAQLASGESHAFLLTGGVGGTMTDLGTLSVNGVNGSNSTAHDISEDGHVVGFSSLPSPLTNAPIHAFIWSSTTGMIDMGTLNNSTLSFAFDINNTGQAVGWSRVAPNDDHAFIYTVATATMTDLNDLTPGSGWTLREARSINDRGQVVGFGVNPSGETHGFLLTPENVGPSPCGAMPTPTPTPTPTPSPTPTPVPVTVQFDTVTYTVNESAGTVTATVTRTGDPSLPVTVDYTTSDGTASQRNDYTFGFGTLRFGAGETTKSFELLLTDDAYQEPDETINLTLSNPTGGAELGVQSTATVSVVANDDPPPGTNPIDATPFFVRMHYHDFFGRSPDGAGLGFWVNNIEGCGADAQCREVKRIDTSAAFYLSIEFQETGFLVERVYKTAFGDAVGSSTFGGPHTLPVPIVRLGEFLPDTQRIGQGVVIGQPGAEALLEANKNAFALEFVMRQRFTDASNYPLSLTPAEVVDRMNGRAGSVLTQTQRDQLVAQLTASADVALGRASVLRQIAENSTLRENEKNRAFVLMQFFGYLRRNPNDPQDTDYSGFDFWLQKLNGFGGDFRKAEMVKAFITSTEYRERFGKP